MKQVVVTQGPIFDKLMQISAGKYMVVRLPVARPLLLNRVTGDVSPLRPMVDYEEWEPIVMEDGRTGWMRRGA